jgi:hypothetical protein
LRRIKPEIQPKHPTSNIQRFEDDEDEEDDLKCELEIFATPYRPKRIIRK